MRRTFHQIILVAMSSGLQLAIETVHFRGQIGLMGSRAACRGDSIAITGEGAARELSFVEGLASRPG
jgi:hypothetical protein